LRFSLPQDSQKASIEIKDSAGNVIRKMEMKNLKAGANSTAWDGKTEEGATAPKGDYTMTVEAWSSNGRKLAVQTRAEGIITGVNFTAHGAELLMGKQVISLADVKSITDPNVGAKMQMMQAPPAGAHPVGMPPQQTNGAAPAAAAPHMMPINGGQSAPSAQAEPAEKPHPKMEVKPETKGNAAKRARLANGSVNDSSMSQGLINHINKEGGKAGMGT
jgi:hypothetical protein